MTSIDTQWPRYQVFQQVSADRPHANSGTVHAVDAEFALLNARDVFVRRPDCVSLWVVPAEDIVSLTAEELQAGAVPAVSEGKEQTYEVFLKTSQRGTHEHAGSVHATSASGALKRAVERFDAAEVLVWWVVPASSISSTAPDQIESLFQPAATKLYRDQAFYHTVTLMRRLREQKAKTE